MRAIAGLSLMPRLGYALGCATCVGLLAFALYLQYFGGQDPCPLCIFQRTAYMGLAGLYLVAAIHGPGRAGAAVYGALLVLVAVAGAAIAARHVWLQYLPKDRIPECGPGLEYILRKYSLLGAFEKVLTGSGECAESGWRLFTLSIAEWSLLWLIVLGAYAVYLAVVAMRRTRPAAPRS